MGGINLTFIQSLRITIKKVINHLPILNHFGTFLASPPVATPPAPLAPPAAVFDLPLPLVAVVD